MPEKDQPDITTAEVTSILRTLSPRRFNTYLVAAGHDRIRALRLYLWNTLVGEAFHVPIQAVEVALRNGIDSALAAEFTPNWWECKNLYDLLDEERATDLTLVLRRIRNRDLELCTDQVVAGLSLGFWVGILQDRYHPPIWSRHLRMAFPDFPEGRGRKSLFVRAGEIASLRNRIWHHEPLIKRDISRDFAHVMEMLTWLSPATAKWIRPHCRVPALLRQKP